MRKLFILSILCFGLFSCSSDENNDTTSDSSSKNSELVGKWFLQTRTNSKIVQEIIECQKQEFYEFKSNGTYTSEFFARIGDNECESDGLESGKYAVKGDQLILDEDTEYPYTFKIEGNTLTLTELPKDFNTDISDDPNDFAVVETFKKK